MIDTAERMYSEKYLAKNRKLFPVMALFTKDLDIMRSRGLSCVHISVATMNIPAQNTCRHFGFVNVGQDKLWGNDFYLYELEL